MKTDRSAVEKNKGFYHTSRRYLWEEIGWGRVSTVAILFLVFVNYLLVTGYIVSKPNLVGLDMGDVNKGPAALMVILPLLLKVDILFIVILFLWNSSRILTQFKDVRRSTWVALFLIMLLGFSIRAFFVPHVHRILFDEDIYMQIGNNIATEGKAIFCDYGTPEKCFQGSLNKEPNGYPTLLSILYSVYGTSEQATYNLSVMIGTATILLIFLIAYLFFDETTGLYTALMLALIPSHLMWSGSAGAELYTIFMIILTVLVFSVYVLGKADSFSMLLLGIFLLAYTVQMRPESGLLILIVGMMLLLFQENRIKKIFDYRFWIPWMLLVALITPHMIHINYENKTSDWGASGKKIDLKYVDMNLPTNTRFWYSGELHPVFYTMLTLVGVAAALLSENKKKLFFLGFWFTVFFTMYVIFYSGSFESGGIGTRFALICYPPVLILGGYGTQTIIKSVSRKENIRKTASIILAILMIAAFLWESTIIIKTITYLRETPSVNKIQSINTRLQTMRIPQKTLVEFISKPEPQADSARGEHDFSALMLNGGLDKSCFILTHNPSLVITLGGNAAQTWYGQNRDVMNTLFNKTDCIVFISGYWCHTEPYRVTVCKYILDEYDTTVYSRYEMGGIPGDWVFTAYKIKQKK